MRETPTGREMRDKHRPAVQQSEAGMGAYVTSVTAADDADGADAPYSGGDGMFCDARGRSTWRLSLAISLRQ
jgi:hypothetical protein